MGGMGKRVGFSWRVGVSNGSRTICWFKFGKNDVDAEGAGIYGSQSRNDFDRDDVEQAMLGRCIHGCDGSPVHSPQKRVKSSRSSSSPLHKSSPIGSPMSLHDSNAHATMAKVHPLPLPPQAQTSNKADSVTPRQSRWQKGNLIGRGTFGSVYVGSNRETGALCAMKEVEILPDDLKSAESIKQLEQEIVVLSQLKHPNIVQYYGSEIRSS